MNKNEPLTYRFHLPCGQELLPLLNQQYITVAVLRDLLRSRGTFINSQDKNLLISKIILTYLTPKEFDYLMSIVIEREEKRKVRNDYDELDANSQVSFANSLPEQHELQIKEFIEENIQHCNLLGSPNLEMVTPDHYKLEFELNRQNLYSNWLKSDQVFPAEINIYKEDKRGVVKIENWYTSEETRKLTRGITRQIRKSMTVKGLVKADKTQTLRFNSFTNAQRIAFLMKYTSSFNNEIFTFEKLTDLSLKLDPNTKSNDERLLWMKDKVSKLNLSGTALEDTFFVTDMDCRKDLLMWRFECRYKFQTLDGKGSILISLEFGDYGKSQTPLAPFQISFVRLSASRVLSSHRKLEKDIISALNDYQLQFYYEVIKT